MHQIRKESRLEIMLRLNDLKYLQQPVSIEFFGSRKDKVETSLYELKKEYQAQLKELGSAESRRNESSSKFMGQAAAAMGVGMAGLAVIGSIPLVTAASLVVTGGLLAAAVKGRQHEALKIDFESYSAQELRSAINAVDQVLRDVRGLDFSVNRDGQAQLQSHGAVQKIYSQIGPAESYAEKLPVERSAVGDHEEGGPAPR